MINFRLDIYCEVSCELCEVWGLAVNFYDIWLLAQASWLSGRRLDSWSEDCEFKSCSVRATWFLPSERRIKLVICVCAILAPDIKRVADSGGFRFCGVGGQGGFQGGAGTIFLGYGPWSFLGSPRGAAGRWFRGTMHLPVKSIFRHLFVLSSTPPPLPLGPSGNM